MATDAAEQATQYQLPQGTVVVICADDGIVLGPFRSTALAEEQAILKSRTNARQLFLVIRAGEPFPLSGYRGGRPVSPAEAERASRAARPDPTTMNAVSAAAAKRAERERSPYRLVIDGVEWFAVRPQPYAAEYLAKQLSYWLPNRIIAVLAADGHGLWAFHNGKAVGATKGRTLEFAPTPPAKAGDPIWLGQCRDVNCPVGLRVDNPAAEWFRDARCPVHGETFDWIQLRVTRHEYGCCFWQCETANNRVEDCECPCGGVNHATRSCWNVFLLLSQR